MSLLFDQNISFRVAKKIQDVFVGSKHITYFFPENIKDIKIWECAKENNFRQHYNRMCDFVFSAKFFQVCSSTTEDLRRKKRSINLVHDSWITDQ